METEPHLTRTGVVARTPVYMAPEQARNRNADFRADLFSLGVVLVIEPGRIRDTHLADHALSSHSVGARGVAEHFVYVALADAGRQEVFTPAEFERRCGWHNDSAKARFLVLDP